MKKSDSIVKLAWALVRAQAEMPVVKFDSKNPFLKNKYASLGAVIETVRPILAKNELAVTQFPTNTDSSPSIGITSILVHSSGEWMEETCYMTPEQQKGVNQGQSAGIVLTYLRRYSLVSILGIYSDEDTDAHVEGAEGKQLPDKVLDKKPAPEPKTPPVANDIQQARTDFGLLFAKAKELGIPDNKIPRIKGDMTITQIKVKMGEVQTMIDAINSQEQSGEQDVSTN